MSAKPITETAMTISSISEELFFSQEETRSVGWVNKWGRICTGFCFVCFLSKFFVTFKTQHLSYADRGWSPAFRRNVVSLFSGYSSPRGLGLQSTTFRMRKGMSKGSLLWFQSITDVAQISDYKWRLHSTQSIHAHVISFSKAEYVLICRNRDGAIFRFRRTKSGLSVLAYLWTLVSPPPPPHGARAFSEPGPTHYRGFTTTLTHTTLHRMPLCLSLYPVKYINFRLFLSCATERYCLSSTRDFASMT
jgi:hypothetical protein